MKWSDGQPFTADDFMFWFEDMYQNKELYPDADVDPGDQRQAGQDREGRRDTVKFVFPTRTTPSRRPGRLGRSRPLASGRRRAGAAMRRPTT